MSKQENNPGTFYIILNVNMIKYYITRIFQENEDDLSEEECFMLGTPICSKEGTKIFELNSLLLVMRLLFLNRFVKINL